MNISALPWDCAAIIAVLAIVMPWRGTIRVQKLLAQPHIATMDRLAMYGSTIAFQWILTGVTVWRTYVRGWDPAVLGLAIPNALSGLWFGMGLAMLLSITQFLSLSRLAQTPAAHRGIQYQMLRKLMPQSMVEIFPFIALVGTVSVCEEFLYRGFLFAALLRVFHNSAFVAIVISSALFSIGHLYQGRPGVIMTFIMGLIFATLRAWSGSLIPCVIVHMAIDLMAGIAGPQLLRRAQMRRDSQEVRPQGQPPPSDVSPETGSDGGLGIMYILTI